MSPGWSEGLKHRRTGPHTDVPDGIGHGIVSVLVARQNRRVEGLTTATGSTSGRLGVKDVLGPKVMDDGDLRADVRMYFLVYQAPAPAAPIDMARELGVGGRRLCQGTRLRAAPRLRTGIRRAGGRATGAAAPRR